ncbi:MAG: STT3 domain-containing protein, partial [Nanoarchaeota archaeon]|nr:STT3 domain-containing protein [Nanoarchaeota archaeon]
TLNLAGLRDISTGGWALGPDLDPWLFTRWAKHIVQEGSLMVIDTMRAVPLGLNTQGELILLPYLMAWFHKLASIFGSSSVEQSSVIFPAFMFALTIIPLFLFVRSVFKESLGEKKANIIGLLSSFFFIILPPLLPRTIAGIPEKESAAFLFMFFALYFFLLAWKSKNTKKLIIFSLLAGASTAGMTLIWGGVAYVYFTISVSLLIAFFLKQFDDNKKIFIPLIWIFSAYLVAAPFTERFTLVSFFTSTSSLITILTITSFLIYIYLDSKKIQFIEKNSTLSKIPKTLLAFGIVLILGFIFSMIFLGPEFIKSQFHQIIDNLVTPITSRLGVTVAENRQPFFSEWANSFGPLIYGIPLMFWLFCIGSVSLVSLLVRNFDKKERIISISTYIIFLLALVFSRYKSDSMFNGTNVISLIIYPYGTFLMLLVVALYIYYLVHRNNHQDKLKELDFGIISLLVLFLLCIVSARGAVRLILMLVPPASIIVSFLIVKVFYNAYENKESSKNTIALVLAGLVIISSFYSGYVLYNETSNASKNYVPNVYNQQWQLAMSWVRTNTSQDAVFAHWWDYGYWIQSIGERATVLDGGNAIEYWNHLMGRYALTGTSNEESLEFLYSHNVTHFLIDSTDIGKYGAFSSIGSDKDYDRQSYLPVIGRDSSQKQETKNGSIYVYNAGFSLDEDIIYEENSTKIFLPKGKAGLGIVALELDKQGNILSQPKGLFVYQNKQYTIPIRYAYKDSLIDFKSGISAGVVILPIFTGQSVEQDGAMIYLSSRVVNSQLARLYLYQEKNTFFNLAHSEDDFLVKELKKAGLTDNDFVVANGGIRGPIKIWEVSYPSGIKVNSAYLNTTYPSKDIQFA